MMLELDDVLTTLWEDNLDNIVLETETIRDVVVSTLDTCWSVRIMGEAVMTEELGTVAFVVAKH
jgi:hypothetical protein